MASNAALRQELAERNAEHETEWYLLINDEQAADLASGFVPQSVKSMMRAMLDWREEDERRAARPVRKKRKARATGSGDV